MKAFGMIHSQSDENEDYAREREFRMWKIDTDASAVVAALKNESKVIDRDGLGAGNQGLFRKFSLKVIEWIRKSLELGRNEVCEVCLCLYLNLFVVYSSCRRFHWRVIIIIRRIATYPLHYIVPSFCDNYSLLLLLFLLLVFQIENLERRRRNSTYTESYFVQMQSWLDKEPAVCVFDNIMQRLNPIHVIILHTSTNSYHQLVARDKKKTGIMRGILLSADGWRGLWPLLRASDSQTTRGSGIYLIEYNQYNPWIL